MIVQMFHLILDQVLDVEPLVPEWVANPLGLRQTSALQMFDI